MQTAIHASFSRFGGGSSGRVLAFSPLRAHAASKEIIELQTQVQQLLDMVQRMQSTLDTRFGVLQHLVEQTADNANQMSATVNALQQKINTQNEALSGKMRRASGQVQSLNDSVDELKTRIAKLDKSIQDLQGQLQNDAECPACRSARRRNCPCAGWLRRCAGEYCTTINRPEILALQRA